MTDTHPAVSAYADTLDGSFPLVLAFGREPNSDAYAIRELGTYDLKGAPRCAFWNSSHSLLGKSINPNAKGAWFKHACISSSASPLLYADALPIAIKDKIKDKARIRGKVTKDEISAHIRHIFSLEEVISRVQLVVLSGLDTAQFETSRNEIEAESGKRSIPTFNVPFFTPYNATKHSAALENDQLLTSSLSLITRKFLEHARGSSPLVAAGVQHHAN